MSAKRKPVETPEPNRVTGLGQLSLVEHALCPLNPRASLVDNLVYATKYSFPNEHGTRSYAQARVFSPLGLSAADELYLWGLLALSLLPADAEPELVATPHWILRQLGVINQTNKRGGRQYKQFADALKRLSAVTYMNDGFYDPVRSEHRRVSFGFFSYSLPEDPKSSRAWRIVWDPLFFEMVKHAAGQFRFDLAVYRELDNASRRLFLFASKVLSRRKQLKALKLEHVAVDLLGFSDSLSTAEMKAKVSRCIKKLEEMHVISEGEVFRTKPGNYFVKMSQGLYFKEVKKRSYSVDAYNSPLLETLRNIGFEDEPAVRLIRRFPPRLLSEWCDITQAAQERFGKKFFSASPMAFLVDSIDKAHKGTRGTPEWWQKLKREEEKPRELSRESKQMMAKLRTELFGSTARPEKDVEERRKKLESIGDVLKFDL